jgi:hypothetical protein
MRGNSFIQSPNTVIRAHIDRECLSRERGRWLRMRYFGSTTHLIPSIRFGYVQRVGGGLE